MGWEAAVGGVAVALISWLVISVRGWLTSERGKAAAEEDALANQRAYQALQVQEMARRRHELYEATTAEELAAIDRGRDRMRRRRGNRRERDESKDPDPEIEQ